MGLRSVKQGLHSRDDVRYWHKADSQWVNVAEICSQSDSLPKRLTPPRHLVGLGLQLSFQDPDRPIRSLNDFARNNYLGSSRP